MGRVLIGWELGAGLGHVTRLLEVARGLAEHGHHPILVIRNLVEPWSVLRAARIPVLQAPIFPPRPAPRGPGAAAISDIFATQGFDNADELIPMVLAWQRLIDLTRPSLIIGDYSPTLCLAAYGVNPMVIVGDGFTMPPADLPSFPLLRPSAPPYLPQERMLEVIKAVQWRRKRPAPDTLPALFAAEARFVCTVPELDPYRDCRKEKVLGPFQSPPPPLPQPEERRFFTYLASDSRFFRKALQGVAQIKMPGSIFMRSAQKAYVDALRRRRIHVHDVPAPIAETLASASAIIHHGGIGTTEAALGIGRPQVVLPRHLEQQLTGRALVELGVGKAVTGNFAPRAVAEALHEVVEDPGYAERAQAFAERLHARGPIDNVGKIVDGCLRLLSSDGRAEAR